eukprot:3802099-Rhodomonas_salina.1
MGDDLLKSRANVTGNRTVHLAVSSPTLVTAEPKRPYFTTRYPCTRCCLGTNTRVPLGRYLGIPTAGLGVRCSSSSFCTAQRLGPNTILFLRCSSVPGYPGTVPGYAYPAGRARKK